MVLCQWEAYRLSQQAIPLGLVYITLAGTMAIYGTDHWAERGFQSVLSSRHHSHWPLDFIALVAIVILGISGLKHLGLVGFSWLAILGLSGSVYLLTTWGKAFDIPCFKELLGAWCFTYLVWGMLDGGIDALRLAFFSMGLANFLHSNYQDRARDHENHLPSFAYDRPVIVRFLAKTFALFSAALFALNAGFSPLTFCAIFHFFWPFKNKASIDWAFLPMLATPFFL